MTQIANLKPIRDTARITAYAIIRITDTSTWFYKLMLFR